MMFGENVEFNFYRSNHDEYLPQNVHIAKYAIVRTKCDNLQFSDDVLRKDEFDWIWCFEGEYETLHFFYENGTYIHIIQHLDDSQFEERDFYEIQEHLLKSRRRFPILEVNITLFF